GVAGAGAGSRVAGAAVTLGSTIYFPRGLDPQNPLDVAWLPHELTHVAQYSMHGPYVYYVSAPAGRARDVFGNPYDSRASTRSGTSWGRCSMAAQAEAAGRCLADGRVPSSHSPCSPPRPCDAR